MQLVQPALRRARIADDLVAAELQALHQPHQVLDGLVVQLTRQPLPLILLALQHLGADSPRVQDLQRRVDQNQTLASNVEQEVEISSIVPVQAAPDEAVVEGRLLNESQRGMDGLVVRLEDKAGNPLSAVGPVTTGQGGYYALRLGPDLLKQLGAASQGGVFLAVRTPDGQLVQRTPQPLQIDPGARVNLSAAFTRADLGGGRVQPDGPVGPKPGGPGGDTPSGPVGPKPGGTRGATPGGKRSGRIKPGGETGKS